MTKIIGHRGARGLAPENTLAALQKGIAAGADEIEVDVRLTSDNVPVLAHDPHVRGPKGVKLKIASHSLAALLQAKPDLATLKEALRVIGNHKMMIEVKPNVAIEPIVETVKLFLAHNPHRSSLSVASKSQRTLRSLHRALPNVPCAVIDRWSSLRAVWRARQVGTRRLNMNQHFLWFGVVANLHRRGYELNAYTLNDPVKAQRWSRHGLGGVITDYPDRFSGFKQRSQ